MKSLVTIFVTVSRSERYRYEIRIVIQSLSFSHKLKMKSSKSCLFDGIGTEKTKLLKSFTKASAIAGYRELEKSTILNQSCTKIARD